MNYFNDYHHHNIICVFTYNSNCIKFLHIILWIGFPITSRYIKSLSDKPNYNISYANQRKYIVNRFVYDVYIKQ